MMYSGDFDAFRDPILFLERAQSFGIRLQPMPDHGEDLERVVTYDTPEGHYLELDRLSRPKDEQDHYAYLYVVGPRKDRLIYENLLLGYGIEEAFALGTPGRPELKDRFYCYRYRRGLSSSLVTLTVPEHAAGRGVR